jgi:hypothetical protein
MLLERKASQTGEILTTEKKRNEKRRSRARGGGCFYIGKIYGFLLHFSLSFWRMRYKNK